MGINSKFDDFKAINLASMADDMMAEVVADHAGDRFRSSNLANAALASAFVPYTVSIDGRAVHRGQGEIFPRQQLVAVIAPPRSAGVARVARRLPTVIINWLWAALDANAVERALQRLAKIESIIHKVETAPAKAQTLIRILADPTDEYAAIFAILLKKYAKQRYPVFFQRLGEARALYRVFRILRFGTNLIGRGGSEADPIVLAWIATQLRDGSPVLSGAYRDAHHLYADGTPLMDAGAVTEDVRLPEAQEFSFSNTVPYSRKIEMGVTKSGRAFVISVPNHLYERVAKDASERFQGLAEIAYEVRAVIGAEQTPQRHARHPHNKPDVRYPSIVVRF